MACKSLELKYNLPPAMQPGIVVIFGYPAAGYRRALKRRLARMQYV